MSKDQVGWDKLNDGEILEVEKISREYMRFISTVKTEREAVKFFKEMAESKGFKELTNNISKKGNYYLIKNWKAMALIKLGGNPLEPYKILAAHMDSPRLDVKPNPIDEDPDSRTVLFKTHYYGGIKKYQWVSRPLAIHGVVMTKDGNKIEIAVGENEEDPVFSIPDLLPHLARKVQGEKKLLEGFEGEKLELVVSHRPEKDEKEGRFKKYLLNLLKEKYGIEEEDFYTADLEVVPAGKAREVGFDKSMIGAYGQDDKICAFLTVKAILDSNMEGNQIVILFDKEEIGSDGNVGAQSNLIEYTIVKILESTGTQYTYGNLLEIMHNSKVISADVGAALNPLFKEVHDLKNVGRSGDGVLIMKYTGSGGKYSASEAQAEYLSEIKRILDTNHVLYQYGLLGKVDEGGGGTVAKYFAQYGFQVVDMGPGLISMHSPFELVSKLDVYSSYKAYLSFLNF